MTDKPELLPCPFCGANEQGYKNGKTGKPMLEELCLEAGGGWRVMCYTCLVKNPHQIRPPFGNSGKTRLSKVEAVTLWNTRAPLGVTKEIECDSCDNTRVIQLDPDSEIYHPCDTCRPEMNTAWQNGHAASKLPVTVKEARLLIPEIEAIWESDAITEEAFNIIIRLLEAAAQQGG